ncbi:MAG TPA: right-handed parallel beta-helix repeat-containing protein [Clostridia bacterium]|nr:right-handed parallel beta-helix repeat-containing protein [Clostridia bacterium]
MAVITVTPADNISNIIAAATTNPGDVILAENGLYRQSVVITKNNIRIIARGDDAIFDGYNMLLSAFTLSNVTGVEIEGFRIIDYTSSGIIAGSGGYNRIIGNRIINAGDSGIQLTGTTGNLILRNIAIRCDFDGILMINGSTRNQVIGNVTRDNSNNGIETYLSPDSDNAIIDNKSSGNGSDGFEIYGRNNLLYGNEAYNNNGRGIYSVSGDMIGIKNELKGNGNDGAGLFGNNVILFDEESENNIKSGVCVLSDYNIVEHSEFKHNHDSGILLEISADFNAVIRNEADDNTTFDISDLGVSNNFIRNDCKNSNPPGLCMP